MELLYTGIFKLLYYNKVLRKGSLCKQNAVCLNDVQKICRKFRYLDLAGEKKVPTFPLKLME